MNRSAQPSSYSTEYTIIVFAYAHKRNKEDAELAIRKICSLMRTSLLTYAATPCKNVHL